jgi:hypothetical protein
MGMNTLWPLLHIAQAALPAASDGAQNYAGDMELMRKVLDAPPDAFPWWIMGLLLLLILACLGAMAAVLFLPRWAGRAKPPAPAAEEQPRSDGLIPTTH